MLVKTEATFLLKKKLPMIKLLFTFLPLRTPI